MLNGRSSYEVFPLIVLILLSMSFFGIADGKKAPEKAAIKDIKSYCLDFNWGQGRRAGFAKPGSWKDADPAAHVNWYKTVGANVIQTFAVSCNGYAWYKSKVVPEQPGLKHDFLTEVVKLGHAEGMKVMGYFCIAANSRWGKENPKYSYGSPSSYHIPYTDKYLAYLSAAISDAVKTTGIDGFMIDWVWQPKRKSTKGKWLESEKELYKQLMGEAFPGEDNLSQQQDLAYSRKAIDRCWKTIRKAAKGANPECIIWLTTNKARHPHVVNSDMYKEVDWLMGEAGRLEEILKLKPMVGKHTRLITCMSDFGGSDAAQAVPEAIKAGVGLYGYAKPNTRGGTIDLNKVLPKQLSELTGNSKRIAVLARAYRGISIDSVWKDEKFVEPERPLPFRIKFRRRRGWSDTARTTFEGDKVVITIHDPYRSGRGVLTRIWKECPEKLVIRLKRRNAKDPGPTHFRIANGTLGVSVIQVDGVKVTAGKMEGGLDLNKPWTAQKFLNGGKSEAPIKLANVQARTTDEVVEITIPSEILKSNPGTLAIEWCNGDKVR